MSEENEGEEAIAEGEEVVDSLDQMAPAVRQCFERGNEIREAKQSLVGEVRSFVETLQEMYPGFDDEIRKSLEGAAAQLLGERDKRKRDERRAREEAARVAKAAAIKAAGGGNESSANPGTNGVREGVHGFVQQDLGNGDEPKEPQG